MTNEDELLSNSVAAQVLNELLPEKTIEQQMQWLQNNRNQSRQVPYRIGERHRRQLLDQMLIDRR
jgi:hypothetical protein